MTHEFKNILEGYKLANSTSKKTVIATVVAVNGSSYRGAGARMLVIENNHTVGAISGGCVEKEVVRQAQSVLKTGVPKLMTYDGRFRLGCEGTLYVLIELFSLEDSAVHGIEMCLRNREDFFINTYFNLDVKMPQGGSMLKFKKDEGILFSKLDIELHDGFKGAVFKENIKPCFRLLIVGEEHDAVSLCKQASQLGWEVCVIASPDSNKQIKDFEGASMLLYKSSNEELVSNIDKQTAVVLMNHNYAKDLMYLKALKNEQPCYIGLLGPSKRKEQMLSSFIEYHFEVEDEFLDCVYGPAGLDIGAETPEEIAISIISEIIAVSRKKIAYHLQDKKGAIHDRGSKILPTNYAK
jgi:xanthine/CO dehydrogenase XdhC/CoxF family maturation factor